MNKEHSSQHRSVYNLKAVALKDFAHQRKSIVNAESATPSSRASIAMNDSVGFRGQEMGSSKRQKTCSLVNVPVEKGGDKYLSIDQGDFKIAKRALSFSHWYDELKANQDKQICGLRISILNDQLDEKLFGELSKLSALQKLSLMIPKLCESTFKSVIPSLELLLVRTVHSLSY